MGLLVNIISCLKAAALGKEGWFFSTTAILLTLFIPNALRFVLGVFDNDFDSFMSFNLVGYEWRRWRLLDLPIYILPFWIAVIVAIKNEQIELEKSEYKKEVDNQERKVSEMSDEINNLNSQIRALNRQQKEFENLQKLKVANEKQISELRGDLKTAKNQVADAEAFLALSERNAIEVVNNAEKAVEAFANLKQKETGKVGRQSIFNV